MKYLLVLLVSLNIFALQFDKIGPLEVTNKKLKHFTENWNKVMTFEDTGSYGIRVTQKSKKKTWIKRIKRINYILNPYIEEITLGPSIRSSQEILEYLFDAGLRIDMTLKEREKAISTLMVVLDDLKSDHTLQIFEGGFDGAFDSSFNELYILDTKSDEYYIFYCGYAE